MKKMGKILPVEAVVGAAMLKNKGWLRGRICFENEVVYTDFHQLDFPLNSAGIGRKVQNNCNCSHYVPVLYIQQASDVG